MTIGDGVALGTVCVGLSGYLINAWIDRKAQTTRQRILAYTDLLKGITGCSAYKRGSEPHQLMTAMHIDARARVLVYGDKSVIKAVEAFWGGGAHFDSEQQRLRFSRIIQEMRKAGGYEAIDSAEVKTILMSDSPGPSVEGAPRLTRP